MQRNVKIIVDFFFQIEVGHESIAILVLPECISVEFSLKNKVLNWKISESIKNVLH